MAISAPHPAPFNPDAVRRRVSGLVLAPGDDGYDQARAVAAGGVDRHPAVIVRVAGTDDVREVIALARETGLELTVRAGGHSGAAHSVIEGGIVLDVRDLTSLEIDADTRTAWAGAGLSARAYSEAAAAHGLATGFGDTGSVGIAGITLGGGVGYLSRKHGLTIDSVLGAEIVTADGQVRIVDDAHEPELFWGVRGGGGNLGVVTRFHFRLHPVDEVTGGMLLLPATAPVLAGALRVLDEAPEELSAIVNVMPCPPLPFVPEERHGTLVVMVMACFAGPAAEAEAALAPLRGLAAPIADMLRPIHYPELFPPDGEGPGPLAVARVLYLDRFDEAAAGLALERLEASDAPMRVVQLRALGGAIASVRSEATAYAHRDRRFMAAVAAFHSPDDRAARLAWVESLVRDLGPAPGAYVNFLGEEGEARVREAYPGATWDRLAALKRQYDPGNLFRHVQNVPPAA